jgi:methyl-accepting chemotaxis protein
MRNLKVAVRLALGFGLLLALMMLAVGVAWLGIRNAEQQASGLERENVALLNQANAMRVAQVEEAIAIRDFVSLPDVDSQQRAVKMLKASETAYAEAAAALEKLAAGQKDTRLQTLVARLRVQGAAVTARMREALDQAESAEYEQAQKIVYQDMRPLQAAIAGDLQALVANANLLARERAEAVRAEAARSEERLVAVLLAALVAGVAATLLITRGIVRPLQAAVDAAERVAEGDLTAMAVAQRRDEAGRVLGALGRMQERLNALVRAIRESADSVSHASERISAGNTDLAARTEEQAASLEETAASVEQLAAVVRQTSEHADRASGLARQASDLAQDGGQAVGGVVQTMQGIQKASRQVSEIVGMMDELAFQTNLLALNAAVEAARAGEHGRGFAVIAAQVRVLAQRSAEASKDIKRLSTLAVGEADKGAKAAARAGETMGKVVRVAEDVAQVVSEIARATGKQRAGIEQVNSTVGQMDASTQSNAGLVQEVNGLAEALLGHARELVDAAGRFKLDQQDGGLEQPRATPAPIPLADYRGTPDWQAAPRALS